ncbi:hypothetical protein CDD83_6749 [Cordyceps sp. RAO-2017]|nr:hypothetical protein CDD83_6749 [Cordyceps sp. RAO-2017]
MNATAASLAESAASLTTRHRVYLGIWTDWSRGSVSGVTLTMTRAQGGFLSASTTFFIGLVSTCFWRILRLAIHRMYSTASPRDALHHQRQALLRNSVTPSATLWSFLQVCWVWRHDIPRALPVIACAAVSICAFAAAGILSSQLSASGGNTVLLDGSNCSYMNYLEI